MIPRFILLAMLAVALIGIFANIWPQANMFSAVENLQTSFSTVVYAGELDQIRKAVDEFLVLREMRGSPEAKALAAKLDQRLNSLELVKMNCKQQISTLELAYEKNPYKSIQETCPALKKISFSKAVELFSLIG